MQVKLVIRPKKKGKISWEQIWIYDDIKKTTTINRSNVANIHKNPNM